MCPAPRASVTASATARGPLLFHFANVSPPGEVGSEVEVTVKTEEGGAPTLFWALMLPEGLGCDPVHGTVRGTPLHASNTCVVVGNAVLCLTPEVSSSRGVQ